MLRVRRGTYLVADCATWRSWVVTFGLVVSSLCVFALLDFIFSG